MRRRERRATLVALGAVVGPGLLAGLSDDDPAGITTYSILGADYGYRLLWVLALSTGALIVFHELGARMGIATGQGLAGLIRERFGVRLGALALLALVVANVGTMCAELAGVAAALGPAGVPRGVSVTVAAVGISALVLRGSFHRVERVLLALCSVFAAYVAAGLLAGPDWSAAARGLVVPDLPGGRDVLLAAVATVGTTLAPWGLAFIQSYAVDKRLRLRDLAFERVDVIAGAAMTGLIGVFVVVACAATLHASGTRIEDASDAAEALAPLAGSLSSALFGAGLLGAALIAASILPLSTAYSVCEALGVEAALDDAPRDAPLFYGAYGGVVVAAAAVVLAPGVSLVPVLFLTQVLNAILLVPLLVFMRSIARDRAVMGPAVLGRAGAVLTLLVIALIAACVLALLGASLGI